MTHRTQTGYRGILKSTLLVGAGSAVGLGLGMVRGKFIAVRLGADGIAIYGLLNTLLLFLTPLLSCGLSQAGVKAVAGDGTGPAHGAAAVSRLTPRLAGLALLVTLLGTALFGRAKIFKEVQPQDLYWLSIGVGAAVLGAGWGAILQGRQALRQMAVASIIAGVVCTALALPCLGWFGKDGIVGVVVLVSLTSAAAYWWVLPVEVRTLNTLPQHPGTDSSLVRSGMVLASGLILSLGTAFLSRVMVSNSEGLTSAGWYQAAMTLAATVPGFALNAMGASLYPQLVAAPDRDAAHALVNRQLQIALMVTGPALVLISTLAGPFIRLLNAPGFEPAVELVRWIALGTFGRLAIWPIGYLLLARSANRVYLLAESASALLLLGCTWWLVQNLGTRGSGIAYAVAYALFSALMLGLARHLHRFRLNRLSRQWIVLIGASLVSIQLAFAYWPRLFALVAGLSISLLIGSIAGTQIWRLTRETAKESN